MERAARWLMALACMGAACGGRSLLETSDAAAAGGGSDARGGASPLGGAPSAGGSSAHGGVGNVSGAGARPSAGAAGSGEAEAGEGGVAGEAGVAAAAGAAGEASEIELFASIDPGVCTRLHLALTSDALYYTDSAAGTVARLTLANAARTTIAEKRQSPTLLEARAGSVYWLSDVENAIYRDGEAKPLISAITAVYGLTLDEPGQTLYYSTETSVYGYLIGAGSRFPAAIEYGKARPTAVVLSGTHLVFTADPWVLEAARIDTAGPAYCGENVSGYQCVRLGFGLVGLQYDHLVSAEGKVYWAQNASLYASEVGATIATQEVATTNASSNHISAFAIANGTAYTSDEDGYLQATPLGSDHGAARVITRTPTIVDELVADSHYLYWTQRCEIWRTPVQ